MYSIRMLIASGLLMVFLSGGSETMIEDNAEDFLALFTEMLE